MGLFSNTQRQQCFSVQITNDATAEDTENFSLNLTLQPGVVVRQVTNNPAVAEITINDNDRKSSSDVYTPASKNITWCHIALNVAFLFCCIQE